MLVVCPTVLQKLNYIICLPVSQGPSNLYQWLWAKIVIVLMFSAPPKTQNRNWKKKEKKNLNLITRTVAKACCMHYAESASMM